ncbi:hypothetical protein DFQ27_007339 [Actinomortierella ambigua]|uniref:Hamartin n=1 Tax=Actinomortierella ambigua TaxID=1343610 RepID=A0A9P6PV12_9FUNG|nr:hypothetical protein DFQ27_007339 [Actinomortierella ambigua]
MAGAAPTIKELYKAIGVDYARYISVSEDSPREQAQGETIQQMMDKFVKSQAAATSTSIPPTSGASGPGGLTGSASNVSAAAGRAPTTLGSPNNPATPRFVNELWFQSVASPSPSGQRHSPAHRLPFAFHRISQHSSASSSPEPSAPVSQAPSSVSSPILSAITNAGAVGAGLGLGVSSTSPATPSSSSFPSTSAFSTASLAPHRLSAHLVSLYQQGGPNVPLARAASRIIVYLTHLMPYLTPRLVIYDWWDRLFEPAFQGEIKLEKASLRACRDLVAACMTKDQLVDGIHLTTGSMLTAGDEEGQLDNHLAITTLAIPQLVLRKYLFAAYKLNHQLALQEDDDTSPVPGSVTWLQSRSSALGYSHQDSPMPPSIQDQYKAYAKTKMVLRRKKDLLVLNLERVLVAYGSNVGRVKDFFGCLYTYFVGIKFRVEVLVLLSHFIRRQRVHLHQIVNTPLFDSLLLSLKYDTSPLTVSLGLTTLIMLMPRIPTALNDRLPDLFTILARVINWPKPNQQTLAHFDAHSTNPNEPFNEFEDDSPVSKSEASRQPSHKEQGRSADTEIEYEEISILDQGIRWLRHAAASEGSRSRVASPGGQPEESGGSPLSSSGATGLTSIAAVMSPKDGLEDQPPPSYIDEDLLMSRVQPLLKRHSVHPNLLTSDAEKEINDMVRWQKLEPMEIVAMCVSLDTWSAAGPNGLGPSLMSIDDDLFPDESDTSSDEAIPGTATAADDSVDVHGTSGAKPSTDGPLTQPHSDGTLGSDDAEIKPMEERGSSESFGPHTRAQSAKGTPTASFARHVRSKSGSDSRAIGGQSSSHSRESHGGPTALGPAPSSSRQRVGRVRGVRMSRILHNFVALRGLDNNELASSFSHLHLSSTRLTGAHSASRPGSAAGSRPISGASDTGIHDAMTSMESTPISSASQSRRNSNHGHSQLLTQVSTFTAEIQLQEYRRMILQLERELMIAMNELNFELFLKQQHIQQISKIHRSHVMDASVEAERQHLYNTCRSLKAQLVETKLLLDKEKAEMSQRKNKQVHWDTDLKSKLQTFREERKLLNAELDRLKLDIEDTRRLQQIQERLLTDERKNVFQLGNSMASLQPRLKKLEHYEHQIEEMSQQLLVWENEQAKSLEIQRQAEIMFTKWRSMEMLLSAEKEEARQLRNRISQQSQILDDMRVQMAIQEGREPEPQPSEMKRPSSPQHNAHPPHRSLSSVVERQDESEEDGAYGDDERALERNKQKSPNYNMQESHRESHSSSDIMPWIALHRSTSNQAGTLDRRKSEAIQEFLWKEKERWDLELQQAQNRLAAEAVKNQQLEDTVMDLRGQLEMALSLNRRRALSGRRADRSGYDGGTSGYNTSVYEDETENSEADPRGFMAPPSKAQDVPYPNKDANYRGRGGGEEGVDSDEGTGMLGRYMSQHRKRQHLERQPEQHPLKQGGDEHDVGTTMEQPRSSKKGKDKDKDTKEKKKSLSRWLQPPALLERSHTDASTHSQQQPTETKPKRRAAVGSSASAARATSGGFFTPSMHFHREGGSAVPVVSVVGAMHSGRGTRGSSGGESVRGTGPSDVSLQSSSSGAGDDRESHDTSPGRSSGHSRRQRMTSYGSSDVGAIGEEDEEGRSDGGEHGLSQSTSTQRSPSRASSPGPSSSTTRRAKSPLSLPQEEQASEKQKERSQARARERERLANGHSLTDPGKLYRNMRML